MDEIHNEDLSTFHATRNRLLDVLNERQVATGVMTDFSQRLSVLKQQKEQLQTSHSAATVSYTHLTSFAESAVRYQYCRPTVNMDGRVVLKDSRHPVVEAILDGKPFVPNDVLLDKNENRVAIITGPNMAGKSTYMRQTALIVLMAQCGRCV